jgi:hypothetical protein
MKIAFEADFGKIWTDNHTPCVFTIITKMPASSAQAEVFFETQVDLTKMINKHFKEAYLISDFSESSEVTRQQLCSYYMEYIPKLIKAKVNYLSFVCPHGAFEKLAPEKKAKLLQAPLGIYPTFTEALAAVNLKRSVQMSQKFLSIL